MPAARRDAANAEHAVSVDHAGDIAVVTLRRPPHNLLTEPVLRALADAVAALRGVARAAVVCSEGRSFCAGADFRSGEAPDPTEQGGFEVRTAAFYQQAVRIFDAPVPLVAAVQGAAIGAGFGLALACDLCVVGELGWFQANFVRLGIHPGFALSTTLPRAVGPGRAADLLLTGRRVDAAEAGRVGIAQRVVSAGDEVGRARAGHADRRRRPLAVAATRSTLRRGLVDAAGVAMRTSWPSRAPWPARPTPSKAWAPCSRGAHHNSKDAEPHLARRTQPAGASARGELGHHGGGELLHPGLSFFGPAAHQVVDAYGAHGLDLPPDLVPGLGQRERRGPQDRGGIAPAASASSVELGRQHPASCSALP